MHFWWSAIVGISYSVFPTTGVFAQMHGIPLADTTNMHWSGSLDQSTLADNSTLSEYVAHTFSFSTSGASVQVAFVPRFNCSPMFSVIMSAPTSASTNDNPAISLKIDNVEMEFPAIIDTSAASLQYSYNANRDDQQKLRLLIDNASLLNVNWTSDTETSSQNDKSTGSNSVLFSLRGSRTTVDAVEALCQKHEPIPF